MNERCFFAILDYNIEKLKYYLFIVPKLILQNVERNGISRLRNGLIIGKF